MADLTPEGLERIEGLARAATPGPWQTTGHLGEFVSDSRFMCIGRINDTVSINPTTMKTRSDGCGSSRPNAEFIAAANPETVLALVARVRELERGLEIIRDYGSHVEFINAALDGAKGGNQPSASSQPSSSRE